MSFREILTDYNENEQYIVWGEKQPFLVSLFTENGHPKKQDGNLSGALQ